MDELNEQGTRLDTMLHDAQNAPMRAHRRSAQIMTSTPKQTSAASKLRRPFEDANMSGLMEGKILSHDNASCLSRWITRNRKRDGIISHNTFTFKYGIHVSNLTTQTKVIARTH